MESNRAIDTPVVTESPADAAAAATRRARRHRALVPLATVEPACCCSAAPLVRVLMPSATPGREPVDLLLCGHHLRVSAARLRAAGAIVVDGGGEIDGYGEDSF